MLKQPQIDPTPIFELFRGNYATELLVAASAPFNVFGRLAEKPLEPRVLRDRLALQERPFIVLTTALCAMQLVTRNEKGAFELTSLAREHLVPGAALDVSGYLGLAADSPGVREMVERLTTNSPKGSKEDEQGVGFIYRDGLPSAMEDHAGARHFTLALAGRARNVAPLLAQHAPLDDARTLIDVGGGTAIYSIACLERYPKLRAVVWDRPEVLKVAAEMVEQSDVGDRVELRAGDMFVDPVPEGDVILLSNVLHDWDVPQCRTLIGRCAASLSRKGRLLVHDVFLNDALDGPLPIALYSASLFSFTEGRAYSAGEYRAWLEEAGLSCHTPVPTLIHCGLLMAVK
jgi:hypothetical protein